MTEPAETLADLTSTMSLEPLIGDYEFEAFYRGEDKIKKVRGQDAVAYMKVGLERKTTDPFYKVFLMGRSGVGKSTEVTRLLREVKDKYVGIRFSVRKDLDPKNFAPFDVILLMMILLCEETKKITGKDPQKQLVADLLGWYADEKEAVTTEIKSGFDAAAGIDTKGSWWDKAVGAFVSLKGSLSYSASRKQESVAYKLTRITPLVETANAIMRNCRSLLYEHSKKDWLFIGEEFDKFGVPPEKTIDLFLVHGNSIFQDLDTNLIFNMPLALAFGSRNNELPTLAKQVIFDTPVFTKEREANKDGMEFAREVVHARANADLFGTYQLDRLIVASGANLRDLFSMITEAALDARVEGSTTIETPHVDTVISKWIYLFKSKLGTTQYDTVKVENQLKIDRLKSLYEGQDPTAELGDDVLGILLQANAVQEFNTQHWFALHPLMVRVMQDMNQLPLDALGGAK